MIKTFGTVEHNTLLPHCLKHWIQLTVYIKNDLIWRSTKFVEQFLALFRSRDIQACLIWNSVKTHYALSSTLHIKQTWITDKRSKVTGFYKFGTPCIILNDLQYTIIKCLGQISCFRGSNFIKLPIFSECDNKPLLNPWQSLSSQPPQVQMVLRQGSNVTPQSESKNIDLSMVWWLTSVNNPDTQNHTKN